MQYLTETYKLAPQSERESLNCVLLSNSVRGVFCLFLGGSNMIKPMIKLVKLLGYTITYSKQRLKTKKKKSSPGKQTIFVYQNFKLQPFAFTWYVALAIARCKLPKECTDSTFEFYAYELLGRMFNSQFGYKKPKTNHTSGITDSLIAQCKPATTSNNLSNITIGKKGLTVSA